MKMFCKENTSVSEVIEFNLVENMDLVKKSVDMDNPTCYSGIDFLVGR